MVLADFHTHILPGIDDGSRSVEQSIAMLRRQAELGVQQVIATPHFYADCQAIDEFLKKRREAEQALRKEMEGLSDLPQLYVGAEVSFFEGISHFDRLPELAITGTRCVMIEMPMCRWSQRNLEELVEIRQNFKLTPIIAHLERYLALPGGRKLPDRLTELPVFVQVNAGFFERRRNRRTAMKMLWFDQIHLIGSDCHNLEDRAPNLGIAYEAIRKADPDLLLRIQKQQELVLSADGAKDQLI